MRFLTQFEKQNDNTFTTTVISPCSNSHALSISTGSILDYLGHLTKNDRLAILTQLRLTFCHLCGGFRTYPGSQGDCQCAQVVRQIPHLWPADIVQPEVKK